MCHYVGNAMNETCKQQRSFIENGNKRTPALAIRKREMTFLKYNMDERGFGELNTHVLTS